MGKTIFKILALILFSGLVPAGCNDEEDKLQEISKNGSIETVLSVDHLNDQFDIVKTSHKIWVKNVLVKNILHTDTIPTLGVTTENGENSEGDTSNVTIKKDYEIYITIK